MEQNKNGKKVAGFIVGTIVLASILVVIIITLFYQNYDPTKYGRNNGGVNITENETEQIEQNDKN